MDNSNQGSQDPNNPNSNTQPNSWTPQTPTSPSYPNAPFGQSTPAQPSPSPWPSVPAQPADLTQQNTTSPYMDPLSNQQTTFPQSTNTSEPPPLQPNSNPLTTTSTLSSQNTPLTNYSQPSPIQSSPTWQPPSSNISPASEPTGSSLDNPWGTPSPAQSEPPPWSQTASSEVKQPEPIQPTQTDTPPTDLSHLISSEPAPAADQQNSLSQIQPTPTNGSENLASQSKSTNPEIPTLPNETSHGGIPKWVIGLGIGLLIVVAGASAYFILGIGQPPKTASVPAQVVNTQRLNTPVPVSQPTPIASTSTSFGELEGSETNQATSAGDLLRQGQR